MAIQPGQFDAENVDAASRDGQGSHWILAALVGLYLVVVLAQGALKLLWGDELFTYYISQQPGFDGIWKALKAGADPNPPLMHLMVKWSISVLGANALGMRAPAVASVLVANLSIWWMLRRWVSPTFAAVGVLAFMATRGFDYAYDARSYAPMMAFAMGSLALWIWSGDVTGWRRICVTAGMAVALAAGVSSNYYGVLAFFPIAVGEALRNWEDHRFRLSVWLALSVASLPLVFYLPLIRHNISEFAPHAWNRPHVSMIALSYLELVEGLFWPVLGLGIFVAWNRFGDWGMQKAERAAVVVLFIYPFLGFAIAVGGAGMVAPRCVAPVCCGFGLAAGVLSQRVFGKSQRAGLAIVLLMATWVVAREGFCATQLSEQRHAFMRLRDQVRGDPAPGDILVGDSSFVLPLYFYSDEATRSRIVFPIDFDAIHRLEKDDSGEQNLWAGKDGVFPFRVVRFSGSPLGAPRILVIGRPGGWLVDAVRTSGTCLLEEGSANTDWNLDWDRVGGVFTPMAHPETRLMEAGPPCH